MKSFIVFALFVAAAVALPTGGDPKNAQIVRHDNDNIGTGTYTVIVETENGIKTQEQAELKNAGTDKEALEVRGQYSYIGNDDVVYTVNYVANELGFQASGAHLPQVGQ